METKQEQAFQEWYKKLRHEVRLMFKEDIAKLAWQARQPEIDDLQAKLDEATQMLSEYYGGGRAGALTEINKRLKSINK